MAMQHQSLIDKLKQRKIVQWALGYVAAAWVIAQVAELLADPWGIPPGWIRILHVFLVAGLPITLILSWFHGERGGQRVPGLEVGSVAAVLLLAGAAAMSLGPDPARELTPVPLSESLSSSRNGVPKLAVLAFSNVGSPDDSFFADGMTAELNSRLSGLRNLAVLSRSSANMYRESGKRAVDIGRELGADYVLSGTVRWDRHGSGSTAIRVTPEMIRVADDTQIWSSRYDRAFEDSLSIQSDVALQVTSELDLALSDRERATMTTRPTENALAYEAYLKGIQVLPQGHGAEADFRKARTLLEQAISLDPKFALAHVRLADADMGLYWFGYDTRASRLDMAYESIEKALLLAPELPEARIARGDYSYRLRDFQGALKEFNRVIDLRPNDSEVLKRVGYIWRRQTLFEEAAEALHRASDLDPLNAYDMLEVAWTYIYLGNYDAAESLIRKAETTDPTEEWTYLIGAVMYWSRARQGDLANARELLSHFPDPKSAYPAMSWINQHLYEGAPEAALGRIRNVTVPAMVLQSVYMPIDLMEGLILKALGQHEEATVSIESAVPHLEELVQDNPADFRYPLALGLAYAALGMRDEALREAARGGDILPYSQDALLGTDVMYAQMEIYATLGETELALDTMAKLVSVPTHFRGMYFTKNPAFAALREEQRFHDLLQQ